jgi:hypothetical protein
MNLTLCEDLRHDYISMHVFYCVLIQCCRHDEEYTKERRSELQKYLQILFKIHKKMLVQKSKVLHSFLEFNHLIDIMMSRREMLRQSSQYTEGDSSPPSAGDEHDFNDDNDGDDGYIDKKEGGTNNDSYSRSMFDMFSMSTGSEESTENSSSSPHASEVDPPPPLKSCLKSSSSVRASPDFDFDLTAPPPDAAAADREPTSDQKKDQKKNNRQPSQESSLTNVNPLEELKDFVRILIL